MNVMSPFKKDEEFFYLRAAKTIIISLHLVSTRQSLEIDLTLTLHNIITHLCIANGLIRQNPQLEKCPYSPYYLL